MSRRGAWGIAMVALAAFAAHAQEFPSQTIRLVIPYAPGGGSDILARPVAQDMQEKLKQPVVVDNRGGAGGNIGAQQVARAAPDGYTLLVANNSHTINPFIYKEPGYDMAADFAPISLLATSPAILVVPEASPAVAEMLERLGPTADRWNGFYARLVEGQLF